MTLLKRLSQLSVLVLLFSVLAVSFHYHGDLADHPDCSVCKVAKTLSAAKKPAPPLLPSHAHASFHAPPAGEQMIPVRCSTPTCARRASTPSNEDPSEAVVSRPAASRASPLLPLLLNRIV